MQRRMLAVAALASLGIAGPVALAQGAALGTVFGGVTAQDFPVVIQLSKTGRKVVRADIGLDMKCQMPPDITIPDGVKNIPVSAAGKFAAEQPVTRVAADPANGVPALDISAKLTGTVNKARTQIKGTWQRKVVIYNPADPTATQVLDTCDTGVLSYTARN
jgi:hypothetical protein